MQAPRWLVILVGLMVVLFGVYRIWFSFQKPNSDDGPQRRGMFGHPGRTHLLIGTVHGAQPTRFVFRFASQAQGGFGETWIVIGAGGHDVLLDEKPAYIV